MPQTKTRKANDPWEIWQSADGSWTWFVLKKWQSDDSKPFARWFCLVVTPIVPEGEMGDVYSVEVMEHARRIDTDPELKAAAIAKLSPRLRAA